MATIKNTLALQDNMSKTLSSVTRAMHSTLTAMKSIEGQNLGKAFNVAKSDTSNAEKQLKYFNSTIDQTSNKLNKGASSAGSFLKGMLGFSALQKIGSLITSQMGSAIDRMDTLNNYTNVMSNLGVSEEQANASRERLSSGLQGLPTTLDSAVSAVQRFTSANSNIGASTEMYLALNNAILAGGADMLIQQSALEQLSQAYSKGKPDMMEWRALQQAMPGQLKQIAQAMGTTTDKLGENLRNGKTSMNDFMKTVVQLNKTGVDGFQSFEEQAKNSTGGIKTSIANMKSAITRGIADVANNINQGLQSIGFEHGISDILTSVGKKIETSLKTAGVIIRNVIIEINPLLIKIKSIGDFVQANWSIIRPLLLSIAGAIIAVKVATTAWAIEQAILNAVMTANPISLMIIAITLLIGAFYAVIAAINQWLGTSISATGIIIGLFYSVGAIFYDAMVLPIYNGLAFAANFLANCFQDPVNVVKMLFTELAIFVVGKIQAMVSAIQAIINTIPMVEVSIDSGINNVMSGLQSKMEQYKSVYDDNSVMSSKKFVNPVDAYKQGYEKGEGFTDKFSSIFKNNSTDKAIKGSVGNLDMNLDSLTGSDGAGGKALKTTSKDDLLSDEDIKLLLDVATRDYKLNYQQVTPNVSVTFGDVRETADVDDVLNAVGDRISELIYADAEVPNG